MECPRCGQEFEVYRARIEFDAFYGNRLRYNDWFPGERFCGKCSIEDTESMVPEHYRISQEDIDINYREFGGPAAD